MDTYAPLAEKLRPSSFADFVGQEHLVGDGKPLRKLLATGFLPSVVLWGPPGTGKTTLARLLAQGSDAEFIPFSAVTSGLPELRKIVALAEQNRRMKLKTVVFIDEIHRWNKAQQDALLPHVESGTIILIGATTENPSFEVIGPLLSRSQVFTLRELTEKDLQKILGKAKKELTLKFSKDAERFLVDSARGDARTLLNMVEMVGNTQPSSEVTVPFLEELLTKKALTYDKNGEEHYNVISAFIKSMRGSDPDAAVYYLARMIEAGEDPKFIARRMVVFASEDVGNADPQALQVATAAAYALDFVGLPEARINLSQAATYLATAPKSNAAYKAIDSALSEVKKTGALPTPLHIRNAPTKLMKELGYGKNYQYAHSDEHAAVTHDHLPEKLSGVRFYEPGVRGHEQKIREYLRNLSLEREKRKNVPRGTFSKSEK